MDFEKDSDSIISQPESPRRFRNLVLGLRVLALAVTTAGIVVSAVATPRSPIAIGILGPAISPNYSPIVQFRHRLLHRPWIGGLPCVVWSISTLVGIERCSFERLHRAFGYRDIVQSGPGAWLRINVY
ncbi:hypothetical protein DER45DRAFT_531697 [Fusarium avenaceum]|nr:hypothetical protein DER45DRAFT_531697 [Fusarium avenaceum]